MAFEIPGFVLGTEEAGDDLHLQQYRFVIGTAGDKIGLAPAGGFALGVLQNAPDENEVCQIMVSGVSKVKCDDPVAEYARVEIGNESGVLTLASGKPVGWALEAGVEGQVISVLLVAYSA